MKLSLKKVLGILKHNPLTLIGTLMVAFIILLGAAAPLVCPMILI